MSDETGAATAAPPVESTPAPAAPEAQPVDVQPDAGGDELQLETGGGKAARRRNAAKLGEQMARRYEAAHQERKEQPRVEAGRPEGGQFKADETGEQQGDDLPAPSDVATPEAAPSEPQDLAEPSSTPSASEPAAADDAPEGMVRIPLPEGHPLRESRGVMHLDALPEQENAIRNGINAAMDKVRLEARLAEAERAQALERARQEALSSEDVPKYKTDPKWQALLADIAESYSPDMAAMVERGLEADGKLRVHDATSQVEGQLAARQTTQQVVDVVFANAPQVFEVWSQAGELEFRLPKLLKQYTEAVDARNEARGTETPPNPKEFFQWAGRAYQTDPRVSKRIEQMRAREQEAERERIRQEERAKLEKEQERQRAEAAERRNSLPPLQRRGAVANTAAVSDGEAPEAPTGPLTATQRKKLARQNAREIGRSFAPR